MTSSLKVEEGTLSLGEGSSDSSIAISSGATLEFTGDYTLESSSTITGSGVVSVSMSTLTLGGSITATTLTIGNGATVQGAATINADVTKGTLVVGALNAAGVLVINGDFTQSSLATMVVEIGGTTPGTGHDQLQISGVANLDGTLSVSMLGGYTPPGSSSFAILTFGSSSGTFSSVSSALTSQYNSTDFSLLAIAEPQPEETNEPEADEALGSPGPSEVWLLP